MFGVNQRTAGRLPRRRDAARRDTNTPTRDGFGRISEGTRKKEDFPMNMVCRQPMTLVRNPILHGSLNAELDRMFGWALGSDQSHTHRAGPPLDVVQEEQRYVVRADLPGLGRDEVEITFQDGVLTIKGEKKQDESPENHRLHLQERFHGSFVRNLRLPERVDTDKIEATMKDGVLELVLPFVPELQPRKIVVNG